MSLVQRDFILRLMEAVAAAIARIVRRKESGDLVGARREVYMACTQLLGPLAPVVLHADARTAADLLGDPRRISAWARLLAEDAELLRLQGQSDESSATGHRACTLLLEASARGGGLDADGTQALRLLAERVPETAFDSRYCDLLRAFLATPAGAE